MIVSIVSRRANLNTNTPPRPGRLEQVDLGVPSRKAVPCCVESGAKLALRDPEDGDYPILSRTEVK